MGPMASPGVDAPRGVTSHELPSRSALLLQLRRWVFAMRSERLNAFNRHYQFCCAPVATRALGGLSHGADAERGTCMLMCYLCRREELQDPYLLSALISGRDHYTDARWMIAVSATPDAPTSLAQLQASLLNILPSLYLGRKVAPSGVAAAPQLLEGRRRMSCVKHIVGIRINSMR